jgi:transcriptional regulator with XRE-family HTH domain
MSQSAFSRFITRHREARKWTLTELGVRSNLSRAEVSRIESGERQPTIRVVQGLAQAFADAPSGEAEPVGYAAWLVSLVDMGERARVADRAARRS